MRRALNVGPCLGHETGEQIERPTAAPPPKEVPRQIRAEGRGGRDGQGHDNAQAAGVSCLRTSTEERWHHGYRHASLVGENPEEQRQFRPRHSRDGVRHYGCCSSGEGCGGGPSRQIRGSRLALNERSAEREIPDSAKSPMSERRRPAAEAVSRGVVKNRSRKDSSVSSLPSVCSTACWLIPSLPQTTQQDAGRTCRFDVTRRCESVCGEPGQREEARSGVALNDRLYHRIQTVSIDTVT